MKIQKAVLTETRHVLIGVLIGDAVMCGVFALLHRFDLSVVWGALLGTACAVGNFFLLGLSIQKGLELGEGIKTYMRTSYTLRMLMMLVCITLGALIPCFNIIAVIVPLFLPRLVIFVMQLLGMYRPGQPDQEKGADEA